MSEGAREHTAPVRVRVRTGWSLACAALLLLAVALGPALRERAERERLAEADARAVSLQVEALRQRLARDRAELRDWGADLLLGRVGAPRARRAAAALLAERAELRALERVDTELLLHDVWPAERRRVASGAALPPGPARDAAERALRSGFPATTPVFEAPGDGPSVTTWVPVLDGARVVGLVGGSFALDALLRGLHTPGDGRTRLELVDERGALLASVGEPPVGAETGALSQALQPFGLPLRLSLRRERVAPALLPSAITALALLTALALVAHVVRRRLALLPTARHDARASEADATGSAPDALRLVAESPAALAVFGRDRRCLASSARWRSWLGLRGDDVAGRAFHTLLPGGATHWSGAFERGMRGARERRGGELLSLADGRRARLSWTLEPWTDARGRVGGVCLLFEALESAHAPAGAGGARGDAAQRAASNGRDRAAGQGDAPRVPGTVAAHAEHEADAQHADATADDARVAAHAATERAAARELDDRAAARALAGHGAPLPADGVTDELHVDARAALRDLRRAQAELALGEHDADGWRAGTVRVSPDTALAADVAYLKREREAARDAATPEHGASNGAHAAHDPAAPLPAELDVAPRDPARASRGRVIVAEHDPAARAFAVRVLTRHGYEALVADDARAALELLRDDPSRVLCALLALDLPGRDALATLHALRGLRADLPVLLVQPPGLAHPPRHDERDGCAVLRRPYRAAQLLRACRGAVSARASAGRAFLPSGGGG